MKKETSVVHNAPNLEVALSRSSSLLKRAVLVWTENQELGGVLASLKTADVEVVKRIATFYNAHATYLSLIFANRLCSVDGHVRAMNEALAGEQYTLALAQIKEIHSMLIQNPLSSFPEFHRRMDTNCNDSLDLGLEF